MYLGLLLPQQLPCAVHCMHSVVDLTHLPCPINNFKNSAQYCDAISASFQGLPHFNHRSSTSVHYHKSKKWGEAWNETNIAQQCRAVGAGPVGPAAAGPIFGPLTRAKMPYELRRVVRLFRSNSDDSCHPQDFCWGWRKAHYIGESPHRSVSFGKLRSQ